MYNKTVWIIYIVFILLYIQYIIIFGDILLADSNGSINDFVIEEITENNNDESPATYPITSPGILFRLRRRFSWYINGKKSGQYSSYSDFKSSWTPNNTLWDEIKKDLNKTRFAAYKDKEKSFKEGNVLMNKIRKSRVNTNIAGQEKRNILNKNINK